VARGSADGGSAAALPPPTGKHDGSLPAGSQQLSDRFSKLAPLEQAWSTPRHHQAGSFLAGADGVWVNGQVLRANDWLV
jgi:3-oxoacyl-[acyl-carrier protein] reductase